MASDAAAAGAQAAAAPPAAEKASATLDMYELVATIGKGSFGTVSKIRRKSDGRIMVWKELNYGSMREKEKQLVVSEVNILRELKHPFIVRYYDRIIDKAATRLYIVMEYCEGGDLGVMIKRCRKEGASVDEDFIWKCFAQILVALRECHRHKEPSGRMKPILHRDLKPGNIFLDAQQNIKIGDFGLAKELASESKFAYTNVGTPFYMSPEMINELKYNEKSDIWALGCLLYELASLAPPFEATNHLSLAVKINAGKFNRVPPKYSEDLHRAIRWMLQVDSAKRPTVEELEKMPRLKPGLDRAAAILGERARAAAPAPPARPPSAAGSRDEELAAREAAVGAREAEAARREAALADWERQLRERDAALAARAAELQRREAAAAAHASAHPAAAHAHHGLLPHRPASAAPLLEGGHQGHAHSQQQQQQQHLHHGFQPAHAHAAMSTTAGAATGGHPRAAAAASASHSHGFGLAAMPPPPLPPSAAASSSAAAAPCPAPAHALHRAYSTGDIGVGGAAAGHAPLAAPMPRRAVVAPLQPPPIGQAQAAAASSFAAGHEGVGAAGQGQGPLIPTVSLSIAGGAGGAPQQPQPHQAVVHVHAIHLSTLADASPAQAQAPSAGAAAAVALAAAAAALCLSPGAAMEEVQSPPPPSTYPLAPHAGGANAGAGGPSLGGLKLGFGAQQPQEGVAMRPPSRGGV